LLDELALVGVSKLLQEALLHDVGEDCRAVLCQSGCSKATATGKRTDVVFAELWLAQVTAQHSDILAGWPQKAHSLRVAIRCT
jgi:hypothetical protein